MQVHNLLHPCVHFLYSNCMQKKFVVWFEEVNKHDIGLVGGKGANLGEMTTADLPIPYGFIVTSHAYFYFIKEAQLERKIHDLLAIINFNNPHELKQASTHVQELIMKATMPKEIAKEVVNYYEKLQEKEAQYLKKHLGFLKKQLYALKLAYQPPLVAVRSSATAEDLPGASFAGQQETYLNVQGEAHLLQKVKECWASLFTERAIYYRHEQGFDHFKVGLAAVIQRMVQSDKSGIAFSIDPVTNDKTKIVIEAIYGLGEYIVQGKVTPDHYEVDKRSFVILKKEIKHQSVKYIKSGQSNKEVKVSHTDGNLQKISDEELVEVAIRVKQIEDHYYFPQDIEWAIEKDQVFIVQSRPITTIKKTGSVAKSDTNNRPTPILTGAPASPGIGVGEANVIHSANEIDKIKHGDVLVAPQTNPDYVPAMKKAAAIVTDKGGRTSHAAIVSRELGIPAVVGAESATLKLKHAGLISVDGASGEIFKGALAKPRANMQSRIESMGVKGHHLKTHTKVYVNLAEPEEALKVSEMNVDGVGLLRAEFMIAGIGEHPKSFIKHGREEEFISKLTHDLELFVKHFTPRPVIYRATDFKTNEYKHLKGGENYEAHEENPMLGFRGASRYIVTPEVFALELRAIQKIWEKGYKNLHLMIPFMRAPWELIEIKEIIRQYGLLSIPDFKLLIMVEVPACALQLDDFIKVGIDGVSIGTNDLTMMLMGVDRDNAQVAHIYDERSPAVVSVLEHIVRTASAAGITSSICGQAASDYPQLVEKLVKLGITSVSVNPDVIDKTRQNIHEIETSYGKH